jgi:tRNA 2-thiouridine synthesizing protein A
MSMAEGEVLSVLADDGMALVDLPLFCREAGHDYLGVTEAKTWQVHYIRRGAGSID